MAALLTEKESRAFSQGLPLGRKRLCRQRVRHKSKEQRASPAAARGIQTALPQVPRSAIR
jgi:hypothetical protein